MRLTTQTDYALRLLMHLAVRTPDLTTIADIATRFGISKNHLMKVAHTLGREGFIETVRGRNGGLRLAKSSDKISVGTIARTLEGPSPLVECFPNGAGGCLIAPACKLKGALSSALEAFFSVLDEYTVADLTRNNALLSELLETRQLD
jgi:Rrf2 family nitric oxide-sensitive transcriptional repressor